MKLLEPIMGTLRFYTTTPTPIRLQLSVITPRLRFGPPALGLQSLSLNPSSGPSGARSSSPLQRFILPDPGHTVPTPTCQVIPRLGEVDGDDTVLVSLQHKLSLTRGDAPELDGAVLGPGYDPLTVGGYGDREDIVLLRVSESETARVWLRQG